MKDGAPQLKRKRPALPCLLWVLLPSHVLVDKIRYLFDSSNVAHDLDAWAT